MSEETQPVRGTSFINCPERGIAIPEEQWLAEQAEKEAKKSAKPSTNNPED